MRTSSSPTTGHLGPSALLCPGKAEPGPLPQSFRSLAQSRTATEGYALSKAARDSP